MSPMQQGPDIVTAATGEARVTPDRAQVHIGVQRARPPRRRQGVITRPSSAPSSTR
jgi:hypothetical protein